MTSIARMTRITLFPRKGRASPVGNPWSGSIPPRRHLSSIGTEDDDA